MAITRENLFKLLNKTFNENEIEIISLVDDDDHWQINITSDIFNSMKLRERHEYIYQILGSNINDIHALKIKTIPTNKK